MTTDDSAWREAIERRLTIADEQRRVANEIMDRMEKKLDQLLMAAAMGKGAFWFATRLGGLIVLGLGAAGWAADHFHWWNK